MSHESGWIQQRSVMANLSGGSRRGAREAGVVHLANIPDGGAGFGAAGLTSWSMTIRTDGAQQVGDAVVADRMLGGGELGTLHRPHQNCDSILPNSMGPPGEILSPSGYSLAESAIRNYHPRDFVRYWRRPPAP